MADYGFVKQSSAGKQNNQNSWNQGDWSNGQSGQGSQQAQQGMSAAQSAMQSDRAAMNQGMSSANSQRSAFGGGNSAFGGGGGAVNAASTQPSGQGYTPGQGFNGGGLMQEWYDSGQNTLPNLTSGGTGMSGVSQPTIGGGGQSSVAGMFNSDGSLRSGAFTGLGDLMGQGLDYWGAKGNADKAGAYVNTMNPVYNWMNQDREFGENRRRWDFEAQQGQWRDTQQADLENRRLGLDTWTARTADQQFGRQLDWQKEQFGQQFGLDQQAQDWRQQYEQGQLNLGGREADTAQYTAEGNRAYQEGQLGIGNRQADTSQYGAETERMLGTEQNRITDWYNQQRVGIEQKANQIDEAYKSGLINNQQRELALQELTQQQDNAYRYAAQAQQESQFSRELQSTEQYRQLQAQLEREQMQNAFRTATMNAVGRNQAQNVRFLRG